MKEIVLALTGATASGKTAFAAELAERLNGEIVAVDSATVYRGFDIGTSKPTEEERRRAPHHLLDVLNPDEPFSAADFVHRAETAIEDIASRGKTPIVVGGTYFYLRALENGMYPTGLVGEEQMAKLEEEFDSEQPEAREKLVAALRVADPASADRLHENDRYRLLRALAVARFTDKKMSELEPEKPKTERYWMKYAMAIPRPRLHARIVERTYQMLKDGLMSETKKLRAAYPKAVALRAIGYAECVDVLDGKLDEKKLASTIVEHTRQLAKRQTTWVRGDERMRFVDERDADRIQLELSNLREALGVS